MLQDTVGFLGGKHTLPAHVEFLVNQNLQVLLSKLLSIHYPPSIYLWLGLPWVEHNPAFDLIKLHEFFMGSPLKSTQQPITYFFTSLSVSQSSSFQVKGWHSILDTILNKSFRNTTKHVPFSSFFTINYFTVNWPIIQEIFDVNFIEVFLQD